MAFFTGTAGGAVAATVPCTQADLPVHVDPGTVATVALGACAPARVVISDGTAATHVPGAGQTATAQVLTTAGDDVLTVINTGSGQVLVNPVSVVASSSGTSAGQAQPQAVPLDLSACSDTGYSYGPNHITSQLNWYYNSTGSPHSDSAVEGALNAGANEWYAPVSWCSPIQYNSTAALAFVAKTSIVPAASTCTFDGTSVAGWYDYGQHSTLAATCTNANASNVTIETDMAFNSHCVTTVDCVHWFFGTVPGGCANTTHDMQGVAAHERGHSYGMNHPPGSHLNLVMNSGLLTCTTQYEKLGLGDMQGIAGDY
jgi:hypothetical protein